ncbi:MAG: adenosine deaminase [Legionella sp.]|jgi:adenosine deaminase
MKKFFQPKSPNTNLSIRTLPKAELHVHLEGTMSPALVKQMSTKYGITLPPNLFTNDGTAFQWNTFLEFLNKYDDASKVVCCKEAMEDITYDYLRESHSHGSIYTELTVSPDHLNRPGVNVPYIETISAVERGIKRANADFGIEARIIVVLVRHLGQEKCEALVQTVIQNPHEYVCGIGLAGDEASYPPALFVKAFELAKQAGLKLTAHAGECTNPDDVKNAIELLQVDRIGHGIHAAFSPEVLAIAKNKNIHFELCPVSNLKLKTHERYPEEFSELKHPLSIFHEQGISYSLGSDDPPFFETNIFNEYYYAHRNFGLKRHDLLAVTHAAIEHSFAPNELKIKLNKKIMDYAELHGFLLENDNQPKFK